jgi:lipopolysaccharide export system protein LptC
MRHSIKLVLAASTIVALFSAADAVRSATAETLTMRNAKYSGVTADGRRYELTAPSVTLDAQSAQAVELDQPQATLVMPDGKTINISAASGIFDPATTVATMRNVILATRPGHDIRLGQAVIDLRNTTVVSEGPFEFQSDTDTVVSGNHLELSLKTGTIVIVDGMLIRADSIIYFDTYALPDAP